MPDLKPGQRVRMTAWAAECGVKVQKRAKQHGVVTRVSLLAPYVWVRPDTYSRPIQYHEDFWEPAEEE